MELFGSWLIDLFGGVVRSLLQVVGSLWQNVATVPCFRSGFVAGLGVALVVGWISLKLVYWWNRVLQFFGPTPAPAIDKGPSPMDRLRQSFRAFVLLLLAVALIAAVLSAATAGAG